ncbi:MAG: hypothetical protein ACM3OB_06155, partial [Acidobacteriota bacterium]
MAEKTKRELTRLLHGELAAPRAAALRAELERDPALRAEYERLRAVWEGLAAPAPEPAPAGFAARVMARVRSEREAPSGLGFAGAPVWAKVVAGLALVVGLALGSELALSRQDRGSAPLAGWSVDDT